MARSLQLALTILARDNGSKVLRKALEDAVAKTKAAEKAGDDLAKSQQHNSSQGIRASRALSEEFKRANSARSTLGIRSEREIQREIQQTIAAYSRLTRMGVMSASEQSRAFNAMTERVSKLRGELSGTAQAMSRMDKLSAVGSGAMAIAGGVAAGAAMLTRPVSNAMTYEQTLANMTNTAFSDRKTVDARRAGMQEIDSLIRDSVKVGGGTKEGAADTLNEMLASGEVDMTSAKTLLPMLQKYSTASGASSRDLSQIAIRLKQTFGVEDKDMEKALNMAISAGQAGGFELSDMAKWLPQQLAAASNNGMKGLDDFAVLLGVNQAAKITAGTSDEAGNNVVNLLGKITSQDAANAASNVKIKGKGIDLPGSLSAAQGKGLNSLDAFVAIIDKVVASNPAYKKLDAQLASSSGSDRRQIMESQAKILEGSAVGQIIADRQALMALIGYRSNREYAKNVITEVNEQRSLPSGETAGDLNFALMSDTEGFKVQQLKNTADFAQIDSTDGLSKALGDVSDKLVRYSNEYPGLTVALSGATTAIQTMTAAAMVFGGLRFLSGKGGINPPPVNPSIPGGVKMPGVLSRLGGLGRIAGRVAAPVALYQATEDAPLVQVERGDAAARTRLKANEYASDLERIQDSRRAVPGFLDVVDEVKTWWARPTTIGADVNPATMGVPSYLLPQQPQNNQPIQINTKVELDSRVIAEAVNDVNSQQATRGSNGAYQ
ncbi:phage tail tape measure protein [Pectobacterium brasiliense]|uniref:phage tail tape measure protein n=1 Tax=Pectobacterium brasiliense TaxID=180957 RepID=UPI00202D4D42|nr:phage tail tape measure protein [Pectobacterium brasiliense]MCL6375966.1 phage tail tape measure protein [Pectobacterium brasiliense]